MQIKKAPYQLIVRFLVISLAVFGLTNLTSTAASAAENVNLILHTPGAASAAATIGVEVVGGSSATIKAEIPDDFGAFGYIQVAATSTDLKLTFAGKTSDYSLTAGTEIWFDASGTPHGSRFRAQGCKLDVHYELAADANSDLKLGVTGTSGNEVLYSPAKVEGKNLTFAIDHLQCDEKYVFFQSATGDERGMIFNINAQKWGEVWLNESWETARTTEAWANNYAIIHFKRPNDDYTDYRLHTWSIAATGGYDGAAISWDAGLLPSTDLKDAWGVTWKIKLLAGTSKLPYIVHKGTSDDGKDPSKKDQFLNLEETGGEVWLISGSANEDGYSKYSVPVLSSVEANIDLQKAIWLTDDIIAWPTSFTTDENGTPKNRAVLAYSESGSLEASDAGLSGADKNFNLTYLKSLPEQLVKEFPYLRNYVGLQLPATAKSDVKNLLKGQTAVVMTGTDGVSALKISGVQIGPVLDYVYGEAAKNSELGVTWKDGKPSFSIWAPTALEVSLNIYTDSETTSAEVIDLKLDPATGIWAATGTSDWNYKYYTIDVKVYVPSQTAIVTNTSTDPYSLSLSTNGKRSQFVNLDESSLKPSNWDTFTKPDFTRIADATIYELMIRDFSVSDESVTNPDYRGGYMAFTTESLGMQHLQKLANAGLTHLQLGPAFDIASVDEDKSTWSSVDEAELLKAKPNSTVQRDAVNDIKESDGFNWGYDPHHFTAPDGSFATDPNGEQRILEFRSMVQGINNVGLRVVMDVVYNHTNASGLNDNSTFDKIVPGYYYRLNNDGSVATSTCCQNTASERTMMEKFIRDSILTWTIDYKVDGFRFDLMGHHQKSLMTAIRADLDALTIENSGVDGSTVLLYGEGWNFGEDVQNNVRFEQATQLNMGGTRIGTFDDRLRDALKGGSPFSDQREQGFGSGLAGALNGSGLKPASAIKGLTDLVKVGLIGGVSDYKLQISTGAKVSAFDVSYNGAPAGYTENPIEQIAYADAHDNEALFDALAYRLPAKTTMKNRIRYQVLNLAIPTLSQGLPFVLAGSDFLRSKSLDSNSYNSGDWFNQIDWTFTNNGFGRGIPVSVADESVASSILSNKLIKPKKADMLLASEIWQDFLRIRYSSPLFRLGTGAEVKNRIKFLSGPKAQSGLIVEQIMDSGRGITSIDDNYKSILVVINSSNKATTFESKNLSKSKFVLHPVQAKGADKDVKKASVKSGKISVPALSVIVFVEK